MLKVKYFLCSDSAAIDSRRNTLSIFHIAENMYVPVFPFLMPRISILASIERTLDEPSLMEASISARQGDTELFSGPVSVNFVHQLSTRVVVEVGGVVIPQPGGLKFALHKAAQEIASYEFSVDRLDGPTIEQLPFPTNPTKSD
jgi:hypothetical protein